MGNCTGVDLNFSINDELAKIQKIATDAIDVLALSTQSLDDLIAGLTPLDVNIDLENAGELSAPYQLGPPPSVTSPIYRDQTADYVANLVLPTFNQTVSPPADFTKEAPSIDPGNKPGDLTATEPGTAPVVGDYPFPADPTEEIPEVPALIPIVIPAFPPLDIPEFTATVPSDLVEDGFGVFSWTEDGYTATVQSEVVTQLTAILGGSTGIPDAVWDMIEERMRKQFRATARQAREEAKDYWASKGHFLSNGQLRKRVKEAGDLEREGVSELIRELVIQDSKIYVERLNNALAQGLVLENQLIGLYNAQQERSLKTAITIFEIGLQVARYKLDVYTTRLQSYQIQAQVFQTLIQAEILKLEEVKVQLEAQKIVGQLNLQTLEAYKAQIQGVVAVYDVFKTQVDAVAVKYEADKTRILAFSEEVKAYGERVKAWSAEWAGYGESVKAEIAKVEGYKAEADAYFSRVRAYGTGVEADKNVFSAALDSEQLKIDRMKVSIDQLSAYVNAEGTKVGSEVKIEELDLRGYEAEARGEEARVRSDAQRLEVLINNANMRMQAQIQETQLKIQEAQNKLGAQTSGLNAIIQGYSQLASSALAALNYAASASINQSNSAICRDNYEHTA